MTCRYNAWGEIFSISEGEIARVNPLRYRGNYFDAETGLYYLGSRYYDPVTCRMLNADDNDVLTASMEQPNHDKNLFAYCDNNPVMRIDDDGMFWKELALGVAVVAGVVAIGVLVVATAGMAAPALAAAGSMVISSSTAAAMTMGGIATAGFAKK